MKKKKSPSLIKKKLPANHKATPSGKMKATAIKTNGKLTKQAEAEARKVHDLYWKSYILGDIETLASLLDDHYTQIGSVENEVFFNKKDAVKFVKNTIDQVAGNVEMRNRITKAEVVEGFILFNEQCDLYVLIEKVWTCYSKFRASSLMQKTEKGWKMIHQHSSMPDSKAQEGENIALEKIAAENLQLREAVKRRTVELEHMNRELAIEAAMEKVRVRSLAMQKPEELTEVAEVLRREMGALGVEELETSSIYIVNENGTTECWYAIKDIRGKNKKLVTDHMTMHLNETWVGKQMNKFNRSKQTRTSIVMKGENRKEWINYCAEKSSVLKGYYAGEIPERTYHLLKFSNGYMGAASPGAISAESWDLLQRATSVFSFAYKRFSDLQKAEAQAREAQIEAALERVRAASMAMHKSEELHKVINVVAKQIASLGINIGGTSFTEVNDDNSLEQWIATPTQPYPIQVHIPYMNHPVISGLIEAWRNEIDFSVLKLSFEEKNSFFSHFFENTVAKNIPEERKKYVLESNGLALSVLRIKSLFLSIYNYECIAYSNQENDIFKRFANVFEQAYTRFLDLQKAEAQAREAQIEAALEKVRSATNAMHESKNLLQVIKVIGFQLQQLGVNYDTANFSTDYSSVNGINFWTVSPGLQEPLLFHIPTHKIFQLAFDALEKGLESFSYILYKEEKDDWLDHLFKNTIFREYPEELKRKRYDADGMATSMVLLSKTTILSVARYKAKPYSEETNNLIKRFGHAFQQTYTRFLDLQKAEAQVRESQIQLALERVRAKTMAMQHSGELREIAAAMHEQFQGLGFSSGFCSIVIMDKITGDMTWWIFFPGKAYPESYHQPFFEHPFYLAQLNKWKQGEKYAAIEVSGEEKKSYDKHVFGKTEFAKIPFETQQFMMSFEKIIFSNAYMKYGAFSWGVKPIDDEHAAVLQRFANVFEQCYTRFLDLQKAEAQAREAQIEATLERVRSRSMAMQKSGELSEVKQLVLEQLQKLTIKVDGFSLLLDFGKTKDWNIWAAVQGVIYNDILRIPYIDHPQFNKPLDAYRAGLDFHTGELSFEEKNQLFEHYFRYAQDVPEERKKYVFSTEGMSSSAYFLKNSVLQMHNFTLTPYTDAENEVLKRIAYVFDQSYTRFLDLQKAEAQAREAQIEAALERVRSRSMAMHKSDELPEVIQLVFEQLRQLNFNIDSAQFDLNYRESDDLNLWTAVPSQPYPNRQHIPYFNNAVFNSVKHAKEAGLTLSAHNYTIEEKSEFFNHFFKHVNIPEERRKFILSLPGWARSVVYLDRIYLSIQNYSGIPYSEAEHTILMRFGKVFQQTYTRFLDLQKAETQAREAQIEAALERVRSRSLAMHKSEELEEVILVVSEQLQKLQFRFQNVSFGFDTERMGLNFWLSSPGLPKPFLIKVPYIDNPAFNRPLQARNNGVDFSADILTREESLEFLQHMFDNSELGHIPAESKNFLMGTPGFARSQSLMKNTILTIGNYAPLPYSEEQNAVLKRFGNVFEQAYTRFLDLQKAEAQAREATIEASLERVRAKTMAMHKSDELFDIILIVSEQLLQLNIKFSNVSFGVNNPDYDMSLWMAVNGYSNAYPIQWTFIDNPGITRLKEAQHQPDKVFSDVLTQKENNEWLQHIFNCNPPFDIFSEENKVRLLNTPGYARSMIIMKDITLIVGNYAAIPYTDEENEIFKRFANVFDQTYTRFLDLQKAEAQAREATIEAALEKVRGKALAMHTSNDLMSTAGVVFTELKRLGINSFRGGVALIDKESRLAKMYSATSSEEGATLSLSGTIILEGHPVLSKIGDFMVSQSDYFPVLKGELLESYITHVSEAFNSPLIKSQYDEWYGCFLPYSEGAFYVWSDKPYTEDEIKVLKRFRAIVDLTFRRYLELQRAEANALDAVRSASLDRVRAEIASMRTKQDLERITPLIWKELTTLGIPFVRCGVFIMDDEKQATHTFLSTPDGKGIAAFELPYDSTANLGEAVTAWRHHKKYVTHWIEKDFSILADTIFQQGVIATREQYLNTVPKEGIYLHFLPFLQGMLYVGNTTSLTDDNLNLIQSVADAFSTAYARYEDFNKIEFAKAQVEKTLSDLRLTQAQLVQSEKMASLGELTAGIAHEIQNPLNFVNNFSEVSTEMIKEIQDERRKTKDERDEELENDLLKDISENMVKINHHGKRAADIVKGMLQHSRSSSGVKEPTDINALADEYLRLAYHGLRAKDKSFNAKFETAFDESVGKVNVIPQDIGRVILNLITNAFYVVNERAKLNQPGYEPTVTISTHRSLSGPLPQGGRVGWGEVLIKVKDNGNGIPQKILDKIFQPFFTTKPTGQGTGLGLSLSYDIVKAHGGELKVETREGEGSVFTILIPV